ncbi:MAG TPA: hypothetical protein VK465_02415 [Fibrobacteria bacterium]|nr:hypothetical protein [Fibrobacteria bacterium]
MKALLLLFCLSGIALAQETQEEQSAPVGQFLDPENVEQANNLAEGYTTAKTGKDAYGTIKNGKYKALATDLFSRYQNSKAGLFVQVKKYQQKIHGVISKVSQRVDRWRTTVPRLRAYKERVVHFADDSYTFARTFEMNDLWDIDRDFSREMEWRVQSGRRLGTSIWDYLIRRIAGPDFLSQLEDTFFPDFELELNKSSLHGYYYHNEHSTSEKVPIFVLNEAFSVMGMVKDLAEDQFAGLGEGRAAMRQTQDNRTLREALTADGSSYTDQLQVRQDILNKLYEVNTKRSQLKDRSAYLDLLWGRLAQQDVEARQAPTAALAKEIATLTRLELDPANFILRRYGLEEPTQ